MRHLLFLAAMAIALSGCGKKPEAVAETETPAISEAIFPQATEVRMYVNKISINVDDAGKLSEGSYPANGIALSPAEIDTLRKSVSFTAPPDLVAACCIPRHAFLFYDTSHKLLGSLTVCFECSCAGLNGGPQPPAGKDWIDWDYAAVAKIVQAHGQPLEFAGP
ncbi:MULTISPECIES: hypothetical protein [Asticcacaulis]|uniref:hypothetical protein n=1 Tax=Asticcacaulis TaxID=76890 RepID=UPI001AE0F2A7|nr:MULTISPECIES: hypothetical protein [Asticcacaulis]MBP2159256.1 hypothetical protein [Asticcacaulis solisilvae]MDR6800301.1 hypothetical protein [Asticcacaulis sp. BE141]